MINLVRFLDVLPRALLLRISLLYDIGGRLRTSISTGSSAVVQLLSAADAILLAGGRKRRGWLPCGIAWPACERAPAQHF